MSNIDQVATVSINLTKLKENASKLYKAENGNTYVTLDVVQLDEEQKKTFDNGDTAKDQGWVSVYQTKEQREADQEKLYVGKVKWVNNVSSKGFNDSSLDSNVDLNDGMDGIDDDLPFVWVGLLMTAGTASHLLSTLPF